jgi:dTDP-4-amino-4,6-dideoxygalactose transaminase
MQIPLSRPDVAEGKSRVVEVLRSPNLSLGPTLRRFEEAFAA